MVVGHLQAHHCFRSICGELVVHISYNSRIIVFHLITIFVSHVVGYLFDWTVVLYGTASDPLENNPHVSRPFTVKTSKLMHISVGFVQGHKWEQLW